MGRRSAHQHNVHYKRVNERLSGFLNCVNEVKPVDRIILMEDMSYEASGCLFVRFDFIQECFSGATPH